MAVTPGRRYSWRMFVALRAVAYATAFIGLLLVFLPGRVLAWSGIVRPAALGPLELAGLALAALGGGLALWCIAAFALIGKGTPAPFDPPRTLVIRGPYRYVRNPMYLGAALALGGAALFYRSLPLLGYTALFLLITHLFVLVYEEPALRRLFGDDYAAYSTRVSRWLPRR
ncbi:MAG TPA: methyltransferase [Gemmatimonadales bacterium]|jgi:protein-S-isoprenylcysteine O-methyltransferase Ste14|nr:methyltransferase [Gemmatimonadales bacterium]